MSEDEKRVHARQLNIARRDLNQSQKRELIAAQLKETPDKTDRQIADGLKVSHTTVAAVREKQSSNGQIGHNDDTRKETSGRKARGQKPKPKKTKYVDNTPAGKAGAKERAKEIAATEVRGTLGTGDPESGDFGKTEIIGGPKHQLAAAARKKRQSLRLLSPKRQHPKAESQFDRWRDADRSVGAVRSWFTHRAARSVISHHSIAR